MLALEAKGGHEYLIDFKIKSRETGDAWLWIVDTESKTAIVGEHPESGQVECFISAVGTG